MEQIVQQKSFSNWANPVRRQSLQSSHMRRPVTYTLAQHSTLIATALSLKKSILGMISPGNDKDLFPKAFHNSKNFEPNGGTRDPKAALFGECEQEDHAYCLFCWSNDAKAEPLSTKIKILQTSRQLSSPHYLN